MCANIKGQSSTMQKCKYFCTNLILQLQIITYSSFILLSLPCVITRIIIQNKHLTALVFFLWRNDKWVSTGTFSTEISMRYEQSFLTRRGYITKYISHTKFHIILQRFQHRKTEGFSFSNQGINKITSKSSLALGFVKISGYFDRFKRFQATK